MVATIPGYNHISMLLDQEKKNIFFNEIGWLLFALDQDRYAITLASKKDPTVKEGL